MSQAFTTIASTDLISNSRTTINNSLEALRSTFAAAAAPTSPVPVAGEQWYDSVNKRNMIFDGTSWTDSDKNSTHIVPRAGGSFTGNVLVPRLQIDDATAYIDKDVNNYMVVTDSKAGTHKVVEVLNNVARNYLYGCNMRTNASNPLYQIDIGVGELAVTDGSNYDLVKITSPITLDITGSTVGGLDTGVEAISTWYYPYVIYDPSNDLVDGILSASSSAPTLPSGYTMYRRVGTAYNDASSNFVPIRYYNNGINKTVRIERINAAPWLVADNISTDQVVTCSILPSNILTVELQLLASASDELRFNLSENNGGAAGDFVFTFSGYTTLRSQYYVEVNSSKELWFDYLQGTTFNLDIIVAGYIDNL